jgi:hypothetical protein
MALEIKNHEILFPNTPAYALGFQTKSPRLACPIPETDTPRPHFSGIFPKKWEFYLFSHLKMTRKMGCDPIDTIRVET